MSRVRRTTAERMVASATDIPQFSLRRRVAVEAVLAAKQRLVASSGEAVRLSLTDFLLRALARGLMAHPALRGRLEGTLADGVVSLSPTADIGLAVDTPSGLLVPVLADLGEKSVAEIAELRSEAVAGARLGRLSARFAGEPVFSLSNLGPFAVDDFTALVSPGETGVLAVGAVRPEPVAEDGHVQVRPMLTLTFSFDHRLIDGAEGARFAARVAEELAASANPAAPKPGS